ncbi:tetratricopeptide repeat protein 4-like [Sycon ciliatum]|uniref:tetratricopeptide repeat protein 4-like n=1 Tax=Sycon ciliatum TaxID=27933 RepID=UPI0031F619A4
MAAPSTSVDDYVDEILAKKGPHVYKDGLSEKDWEKELENIPLFMSGAPEEGSEMSDAIAALQALQFEDATPEGRADAYKDEGNDFFKKKKYRQAIIAYTEGLKEKVTDAQVRVVLLSNRAAAQYRLGNNRSAFDDCKRAYILNPLHLKALVKGAESANAMNHHKDTVEWCDRALQLDAGNKRLLEMRKEADKQFRLEERNQRKAAREEQKRLQEDERLEEAIRSRGIVLSTDKKVRARFQERDDVSEGKGLIQASLSELEQTIPSGSHVRLDSDGVLHWPVLLVYPEHHQTDFIQAFDERSCFRDHFNVMFSEAAPWDANHEYKPSNLSIYYEDTESGRLASVSPSRTLQDVLMNSKFVVRAGTPVFIILAKKSKFGKDFLSHYP